jgi:hypothetical protein
VQQPSKAGNLAPDRAVFLACRRLEPNIHPDFIAPLYPIFGTGIARGSRREMVATEEYLRTSGDRSGGWVPTVLLAASVLLIVLIIAGYGLGWQWTGFPGSTLFDWLKILVFPAAVAIGTVLLNRAAKARENARDQDKSRNDDRRAVLAQVISAYNETKKVRRILKANIATDAETGESAIPCTVYEEQLKNLMDPQLRFELYKPSKDHTVNAFLRAFRDPDGMAKNMGELETYLNGVIEEYDDGDYQKLKVQGEGGHSCRVLLKDFKRLDEFVTTMAFIDGFSSKFRRVATQMQKEILDF